MSLIVGRISVIPNVIAPETSPSRRALECSAVLRAIFRASLTQIFPVFCEKVVTAQLPDPARLKLLTFASSQFSPSSIFVDVVLTMAELGMAASVVSVISFGIQIAQGLIQYYGSWRDQDSDVADMCASLDSLSRTLAVLSETFQRHDPPSMSMQKHVVESVDCVNIAMKKLEDELKKVQNTESPKPGVRAAMRRHVRRALYPFKEETLRKIQNAVSEARSDLNLTLQVLHMLVYPGLISLVLS